MTVAVASVLRAEPERVLARVMTLEGVNDELRPFFRMTAPPSFRGRSLLEAPVGVPLFRSWLLLGGILPIDFDHLMFESVDPASGFVEHSVMLTMASWRHERRVRAHADGAFVVDRLSFAPRVPGSQPVLRPIVRLLFEHRHARLRGFFGGTASDP